MISQGKSVGKAAWLHLAIVYVVWGSTYLAIRLGVRGDDGFPPFTLAAMRVFSASAILLAWAYFKGERLRLQKREAAVLFGTGLLMWVGGNGLVTWAEQRADSGLAALLVAVMPIWAAIIEAVVDRRMPSWKIIGSLMIGFVGVAVLSWPILREGSSADTWAVVGLLAAPFWWAIGSVWYTRRRPDLSVRAVSGYQHLFGGLGFLVVIMAMGETVATPSTGAWLAWIYLTIFGSVIAFTSYISVLRLLPVQVGMTYAYVNPVIAVFLGWLIISEQVTGWTLAGTVLVVAGVAGVFNNKDL
jgi:drug/metabolite transporter (DMT)-like permease